MRVNINEVEFNLAKMLEEFSFFLENYGSGFKPGMGAEEILSMIARNAREGDWIDFGGGSNTLFWASAFKKISRVSVLDLSVESLVLTDQLQKQHIKSQSFDHVYKIYKKNFETVRKLNIEYFVEDLFAHPDIKIKKAINISQFGLLGLSSTKEDYFKNFNYLTKFLDEKGVLICSNWVFKDEYAQKKGFHNKYMLEPTFITELANRFGMKIIEKNVVEIDDKNFSHIMMYCMEKVTIK